MRVVTSREFNQDVSKAKRFAQLEPVFVTDRGRPTHVLLGIDAYRELNGPSASILDGIAAPEGSAPLVALAAPRGLGGRG
jgi:hypothetical protein